jgi:hypothetical protein
MILAFAFAYGLISLSNAKTYINELNFLDDQLIVVGHDYDSPWEKQFSIKNSNIKINSKGRGRGKVGYYFAITSGDLKVEINRSFNWDYSTHPCIQTRCQVGLLQRKLYAANESG